MAQSKTIQLLRSSALYGSKEAAKSAILALTGRNDGEVVLARYEVGTVGGSGDDAANLVAKSLLGIYHKTPDLTRDGKTIKAGWTIIEDASDVNAILEGLDANTNVTKSGSGSEATYAGTDDSLVIIGVMQENGQVTSVSSELSSVKLASVSGTNAAIAAEDTLGTALGKLQAQIEAMDSTVSTAVNNGDVITSISETNGVVTANKANMTDVLMTGYTKDTAATGSIAATDTLEGAFSKVENSLGAVTVKSTDKTVTITNNSGKDLAVNIDGQTLVKDATNGTISSALKVIKVIPEGTAGTDEVVDSGLGTNIQEAYRLVYGNSTTAIGKQINIYKDSALKEVYLGTQSDTVNPSTGEVTKQQSDDPQSLNFVYHLTDNTYSITKVDVSKFLSESEFADGLQVANHVVSVKIDSSSEKNSQSTPVDFLTVSSNGVKVSGIKDEIDRKIAALDVTDTAVAGQYVSAVNETDGKVSMTRANVSEAVLNNYSKGSSADPVAATDTVNAAISKLENQVDAAMDAATAAHTAVEHATGNTHVTVSASQPDQTTGKVTYTVNETNIANADDLTAEIAARKAVDGQSGDTYTANANANYISGATSLNNADVLLDTALKTADDAMLTQINGSNAIEVSTKANKEQTVSLKLDTTTTTGNITSDMLEINSNGLMMKDTWDCGVF